MLAHLGVAQGIARRYRNRGIPADDLEQVARLGLVKAARSYDPNRQNDFLAYAVPTIRGEVRKHFRDHGWMVRPPRRVQELQSRILAAAADLTQQLGRSPRPVGDRGGARPAHRRHRGGARRRRLLHALLARPARRRLRRRAFPR